MNVGDTYPAAASIAPPDTFTSTTTYEDNYDFEESPLSHITNAAGFSSIAPTLQAALAHMDQPGASMLDTLAENIARLQDAFVDTLYEKFRSHTIDLTIKLTIALDTTGQLILLGEHPDAKKIISVLQATPDLSIAFSELASQSAALRDIRSLQATLWTNGRMFSEMSNDSTYQVSLKGEMNHFYFSKQ